MQAKKGKSKKNIQKNIRPQYINVSRKLFLAFIKYILAKDCYLNHGTIIRMYYSSMLEQHFLVRVLNCFGRMMV